MLIDTILNEGKAEPSIYRCSEALVGRLRASHKFVLARDFAQVTDELGTKPHEIVRMLPFCRLPYEATWIEMAHADRAWFERGTPVAFYEDRPTRVGFLLSSGGNLAQCKAHLFWNFAKEYGAHTTLLAMEYNFIDGFPVRKGLYMPGVGDNETNKRILQSWNSMKEADQNLLACAFTPVGADIIDFPAPESLLNELISVSVKDWGGEVMSIIATLGLLNTRNIWDREVIEMTNYNAKRRKYGAAPLVDHQVISISKKLKARVGGATATGHYGQLRAHFVRGHWKVRRTGVFYWKPFARGRGEATPKLYRVGDEQK